jgi:hypothetical protein
MAYERIFGCLAACTIAGYCASASNFSSPSVTNQSRGASPSRSSLSLCGSTRTSRLARLRYFRTSTQAISRSRVLSFICIFPHISPVAHRRARQSNASPVQLVPHSEPQSVEANWLEDFGAEALAFPSGSRDSKARQHGGHLRATCAPHR